MTAPERVVLRIDRMTLPAGYVDDDEAVRSWLRTSGLELFAELERSGTEVFTSQVERSLRRALALPLPDGRST